MTYFGAASAMEDAVDDSLAAIEAAIPIHERERRDSRRRYWQALDRRLIREAERAGVPLGEIPQMEKAMSQHLTTTDPRTGEISEYQFDDRQINLIRNMLDKDATDGELQLLIAVSQRLGLDPFAKELYGISRYSKAAGRKVMAIQIGVDGLRKRAARSGAYAGQRGPFWCGEDGQWKDVWLSKEYPAAAKVGVVRKGETEPVWGVATWAEFAPIDQYGLAPMWKQYSSRMLAKSAESEALRKACPDEVANIRAVIIESGAEYEPALAAGDVEGEAREIEEPAVVAKNATTQTDPEKRSDGSIGDEDYKRQQSSTGPSTDTVSDKARDEWIALVGRASQAGIDLADYTVDLDTIGLKGLQAEYVRLQRALKAAAA